MSVRQVGVAEYSIVSLQEEKCRGEDIPAPLLCSFQLPFMMCRGWGNNSSNLAVYGSLYCRGFIFY